MELIAFMIYRWLMYPIGFLLLQVFRPLLPAKLKRSIELKNQKHFYVKNVNGGINYYKNAIWIHAASGEIEYAKPLIRLIKTLQPEEKILVTYSSPSAIPILKEQIDIDAWGPAPWDSVFGVKHFLKVWQPKRLFIARTDVWPELAYQCRQKKIPSLLFAATFAENSSRLKGFSKSITLQALKNLDKILVVNDEDLELVKRHFKLTNVFLGGDTRYDQVIYRLKNPKQLNLNLKPSNEFKKVFIMGSTWPEDDQILLPVIARLVKSDWRFILAPHEVNKESLEKLILKIRNQEPKINFALYSEGNSWSDKDLLIVDQVGILAEIYQWGCLSFVGGSFKKQVHSVMEPLAAGLPVLVGPHHKNNREALEFRKIQSQQLKNLNWVNEINNSEELYNFLVSGQNWPWAELKTELKNQIEKKSGASMLLTKLTII